MLDVSGLRAFTVDRMHLVWQDEEERRELLFDRDKKLHFGLLVKKEKKPTMNPVASTGS